MDDKGYAFTPMAFLLLIPVIIIAVAFSGLVNEVNSLSLIAIGGDVTSTVASNVVKTIKEDTADAGRNASFLATRQVIDSYSSSQNNNPFFGGSQNPTDSRSYIENRTLIALNLNLTNTCRELEKQTGRDIIINGNPIDVNGTGTINIFQPANMDITQSDPYGFNITLSSVPVKIIQNSTTQNQSFEFNTPPMNVYISVERLEDPYIWVNTLGRNSSVIFRYPYYTSSFIGGNASTKYRMGEQASSGKLQFLNQSLVGPNTVAFGYMPFYFPDEHGLSFFDRLENRTNNTSISNATARMSTFILWDPVWENIPGKNMSSYLDHEYFAGIQGTRITTTHSGVVTAVTDPTGRVFYLSSTYKVNLGLFDNYNY
jgi:hypothetical protein